MQKLAALGLAFAFLVPSFAQAQTTSLFTLGKLRAGCKLLANPSVDIEQALQAGTCVGAIYGATQGLIHGGHVCIPDSVKLDQIVAVFVKDADAKPDKWHEDFYVHAYVSLAVAFPCQKQ